MSTAPTAEKVRIVASWAPREETTGELCHRLHLWLTTLEGLDPELGGWQFEDASAQAIVKVGGAESIERAFAANRTSFRFGNVNHPCDVPRFWLGPAAAPHAEIELTLHAAVAAPAPKASGEKPSARGPNAPATKRPPLPVGIDYLPNRLRALLPVAAASDAQPLGLVVENALRSAIALLRPDFAHAVDERTPAAGTLDPGARPAVGWLTYLSSAYPKLARDLPKSATAASVGQWGTLFTAHAEPVPRPNGEERAALAQLEATLEEAGLLVTPPALAAFAPVR